MQIDMSRLTRAGQEARFRAWASATAGKPWLMPSEVRAAEGFGMNDQIETLEKAQVEGAEAAAESFANRVQGSNSGNAINTDNKEKETANASA
jgi:hypothetical protein